MGYWQARSDRLFIEELKRALVAYWENSRAPAKYLSYGPVLIPGMPTDPSENWHKRTRPPDPHRVHEGRLRAEVLKRVPRARDIASRCNIPIAIGTEVTVRDRPLPSDLFLFLVHPHTHVSPTESALDKAAVDALIQIAEICRAREQQELLRLLSPSVWITFFLRIPSSLILVATDGNPKIQEQVWAKALNLLWLVALMAFLVRYLGVTKQDLLQHLPILRP